MEFYQLKDSTLLIYPNGKFTLCTAENAEYLAGLTPDSAPNFELTLAGGKKLTLGENLHFSGASATENGCTLTYTCPQYALEITTVLETVAETDVVVQTNHVKSIGASAVTLTSFSSASLENIADYGDMPWYQNGDISVYICHSKWQGEGQWRRYTPSQLNLLPVGIHPMECGRYFIRSIGSWSTVNFYPLVMVEDRLHRKTWFMETEGSHSWFIRFTAAGGYTQPNLSVAASGCDESNGDWYYVLKPNEAYTAERAFFGLANGFFEDAVAELTAFKRLDSSVRFDGGVLPLVFNDYMNCIWAQQDPAHLYPLIDKAAEVGAEVFCIDGGWCEKANGKSGLGDWLPQHAYYDWDGLKKIADYIRAKNMVAGIWLELDSCDKDAYGATLDENAVLKRHGAAFGDVLTYNFANKKVCEYLTARVGALYEAGFRFIKNDYNHTIDIGATNNHDGNSPAEGGIVAANSFYAFVDSLYARFPDLIIENCGSGALRSDNKMLRRCYLQSTSDQEHYFNNPSIVMGSAAIMPPEKAGIWSFPYPSVFPYDECGNYIPFAPDADYVAKMADGKETVFNMVTAMAGFLYLSGRIDVCDEKNFALIQEGVRFYKKIREFIPRSRPIYPLGLASIGEKACTAMGLLSESKLLLAVWNMADVPATLSVPLARYLKAPLRTPNVYPQGASFETRGREVLVPLAPNSAAYLAFDL